jgi:hypothetical protein
MIQPDEIREKAEKLYSPFLKSWLAGASGYFPRIVPSNKSLRSDRFAKSAEEVQRLRDGSREVLGYGYTVEWEERRSRNFGLNRFPVRVFFETQDDFLRFINRRREFEVFSDAVGRLREEFPQLNDWIRSNRRLLINSADSLDGLLHVVRYLRKSPRPNCFARELPIPVDTKFIERHERVLRQWLDILLAPEAIRADESDFARRFGLRGFESHWLIRLLDPALQAEIGFPCSEFSIPLRTLAELTFRDLQVIIVENKVNLITLPSARRTLALGGVGRAATELRQVGWLRNVPITYWGDIDVYGLSILSAWRVLFPQTKSLFMDSEALDRFGAPGGSGDGVQPEMPRHLTEVERKAFARCCHENIRLEQERIPHNDVVMAVRERCSDASLVCDNAINE